MPIALLTDIHGNREALDACLADVARVGADRVAVLGDLVGYGADPEYVVEKVALLARDGAVVLKGNHDDAVEDTTNRMNPVATAAIEWTRGRLGRDHRAFLAGLSLEARDGERLFVHANTWAPGAWDYILGARDAERALRYTDARVVLLGHTHVPAIYHLAAGKPPGQFRPVTGQPVPLMAQRRWVAVIGSVGQPRDLNPAACWGLYDEKAGTLTYRRVPYDIDAAARKIRAAGLPERLARRLHEGS